MIRSSMTCLASIRDSLLSLRLSAAAAAAAADPLARSMEPVSLKPEPLLGFLSVAPKRRRGQQHQQQRQKNTTTTTTTTITTQKRGKENEWKRNDESPAALSSPTHHSLSLYLSLSRLKNCHCRTRIDILRRRFGRKKNTDQTSCGVSESR